MIGVDRDGRENMRSREAIKKAKSKYEKVAIKRVTVKLNKRLDEDMIEHLDGKENVTAYIKQLIKADMEKGGE